MRRVLPDVVTLERVAALLVAASIGGWMRGRVAGWPLDGVVVAGGLLGYAAYRDQRRRHLAYPPRDDEAGERASSLALDGSPCRGWPAYGMAARLVETIEHQLGDAGQLERGDEPWR